MKHIKAAIIIVLFHPSQEQILSLKRFYEELKKKQVMIVVDNTPNQDLCLSDSALIYIPLRENQGIACAQNIGIKKALKLDCSHLVFFDQDTQVNGNFIEGMLKEFEKISTMYPQLFLLGPTVVNGDLNKKYSSVFKYSGDDSGFSPRLTVISSGSCVNTEYIHQVGFLDEKLFIDGVDHEWCMRAKSKGFICGITENISINHYVGQKSKKVLGIEIIVSTPLRYYYQTRNWLWLLRRSYIPLSWKVRTTLRKLYSYALLWAISNEPKKIYIYIFKGLKKGFS